MTLSLNLWYCLLFFGPGPLTTHRPLSPLYNISYVQWQAAQSKARSSAVRALTLPAHKEKERRKTGLKGTAAMYS